MSKLDIINRQQDQVNWQLAVDLANNWRRMMNQPEVKYPYPGRLDEPLSINAP
jgi:hypothetical protein